MLQHGYLRVGRFLGAELRVHWSVPVSAVLFTRGRFEPILWLCFFVIIVVHQLGHIALTRLCGFSVASIDLTGVGGHCRHGGRSSQLQRALIAWGGMFAQSLLVLLAVLVHLVFGGSQSRVLGLVREGLVNVNLWILALNLLPLPMLDGSEAWQLFVELKRAGWTPSRILAASLRHWARKRRDARLSPRRTAPSTEAPEAEAPREVAPSRPAEAAAGERDSADSEPPQPSAQAQRELAALLERIADKAGNAKKRR